MNKNLCQKCGKEEIVGKKKKMFWLGCEACKCDYWVHASCNGLILKDERQMSSISFYCPEHVKNIYEYSLLIPFKR